MRGQDEQALGVFSYVSPVQRIPPIRFGSHVPWPIRPERVKASF